MQIKGVDEIMSTLFLLDKISKKILTNSHFWCITINDY
ncbi:MAG: hypothetical protein K0S30_769 [Clostridia bacterium]|nr:hypothetical protein [Clostridia bacterium]